MGSRVSKLSGKSVVVRYGKTTKTVSFKSSAEARAMFEKNITWDDTRGIFRVGNPRTTLNSVLTEYRATTR